MKKFVAHFFQGLLLFIPLVITGVILVKIFDFFASLFSVFGYVFGLSNNTTVNTILGLFFTLLVVALLGMLASSYVFKQVFTYFEEKLEHAPFIRHIYSPVKDFTDAFVGNKKRFNKPVMVLTNPQADIYELGFITRDELLEFDIKDKFAVYMPLSYSLSGRLLIVPRQHVKPLDAVPAEVMKFVVSGGVTDVE